ncbi:MAG: hypothetical protein JNK77_20240 [Saprospiraceae bacterium]|nr:hypothetical protein [Saprospiraceae bacterium]
MLIFQENTILQKTTWTEKTWTIPELLEDVDPLAGEPLTARNEALQKIVSLAPQNLQELSKTAQLHLDFWDNFQNQKMEQHAAIFRYTVGENKRWELTINELGLFYRDFSGQYMNTPGGVMEQLFSNFWFYGPLRPLPDLHLREKIISTLKQGFENPDCPSAKAHFELFEYPQQQSPADLAWEEGDHVRRDFTTVRPFGIELGHTTWRDGWSGTGFISFEKFLHLPPTEYQIFSPEIRAKIEQYLGKTSLINQGKTVETEPKPPTPGEKMDAAEALLQNPASEEGATMLISLLDFEAESDYWRNYVFNRFFKLRENPVVQNFLLECLRSDDEIRFNKSRDVLMFWGLQLGEQALSDKALLKSLNWEDATANDPDFRAALEKVGKIITRRS